MKHTRNMALALKAFLQDVLNTPVEIIGSLARVEYSENDIDVFLPLMEKTEKLKTALMDRLETEDVEDTDWGGWFFTGTILGNVDVFFEKPN
jgi:predicted nucleotidyltransferase